MTFGDFWAGFAAVVALASAILTIYIYFRQLRIQRLDKYLSAALYVTRDCYKAAQVFVSTWTYDQESASDAFAGKKLTEDQKRARSNFEAAWRKFDADLTASSAVIEAAEGVSSSLVESLTLLHGSSSILYDKLMNERVSLRSEDDLEILPEAIMAKIAAVGAAKNLAKKLNSLYRA